MTAASASALSQFQGSFASALFADPSEADAQMANLIVQPAFAVYRNTVMKACIDALEANYPSVARLVGTEWFRSAAALHVAASPPTDGRLVQYGAGFPQFLRDFAPASQLPYLPGVAQLDRFWTESHIAADAPVLEPAILTRLAPEALGAAALAPHPATRWAFFADLPIFTIWQRNRTSGDDVATQDDITWHGEGALLTRTQDVVQWHIASAADCAFLDACAQGACLADAAEAAVAADQLVDLAALLSRLLQAGAFQAPSDATDTGASS
ncbi:DNA-binding domain-containing protein [Variovorax sp. J22R133]|uniref:HvfC/BufC N-terminal domain-containing protein n=1 Tax=Variovorax brevis TaxID=3053503 RepID=UPI0025766C94|nr:DNA-binding domain-containing protein [Variovorax sp. J22R133]MDM0116203.1 DNA-binding domain-containing protein [Variovorax sp. J22R133]